MILISTIFYAYYVNYIKNELKLYTLSLSTSFVHNDYDLSLSRIMTVRTTVYNPRNANYLYTIRKTYNHSFTIHRDTITQRKLPWRTMKRIVFRVEELLGIAAARHRRSQWMIREDTLVLASVSLTHVTHVAGWRTNWLMPKKNDYANANYIESYFDL